MIQSQTPYNTEPGEYGDYDAAEIAAWFGKPKNAGINLSSAMAAEAVEVVARRRPFHPVVSYLDGLVWDGESRLEHLMTDIFGAPKNEYTAAAGHNWLISAVARVRKPGCKVDTMIVLEGAQGLGKSSAVRTLCGPEWFAEMLESPQNKDFYQVLSGRWVVEIAEMQAFSKADRNRIKQAITAQEDTFRPSYGRFARQYPRQCIFVGTTNDIVYLKDETGGRRTIPIACTGINVEMLRAERDQYWAEADHRFKLGESWWKWPDQAKDEQEKRYDADAWEDPIRIWLNGERELERYPDHMGVVNTDRPVKECTISDVMRYALGIEVAKHSRQDQMRVGAILRRFAWDRVQRRSGEPGQRKYIYSRPIHDDPS